MIECIIKILVIIAEMKDTTSNARGIYPKRGYYGRRQLFSSPY
jgi:hypothetical protein